jgi:hypothetical protein
MPNTVARPPVHLRIGGESQSFGSGGTHEHVDPATGQIDARIPLAGVEEVDRAVAAAQAAFEEWRRTPPGDRRRFLLRLADLIEANTDEFARRGTMDNGTPAAVVAGMVESSVEWTRYYAGWADKVAGELSTSYAAVGELNYTLHQPYGVIGIIITWNGPLVSLAMKIPAALAAGNTVVVKPSEMTPFSGELFMDLVVEAGLPLGVVNMLPGAPEAGEALVAHPLVQKISFTGGPVTARKILHSCAERMKPAVLELGGKSANIIFDDADLDIACGHGAFMSVGILSGRMRVPDSDVGTASGLRGRGGSGGHGGQGDPGGRPLGSHDNGRPGGQQRRARADLGRDRTGSVRRCPTGHRRVAARRRLGRRLLHRTDGIRRRRSRQRAGAERGLRARLGHYALCPR